MKKSMLWLTLVVALSLIVLPGCSAMNLLPVQPARASAPVVVAPTPMSGLCQDPSAMPFDLAQDKLRASRTGLPLII